MPNDGRPGQIKVTDRVEHFVADKLVVIAQAAAIEDPVAADDDNVVERAATRQTRLLQPSNIVEKTKGARAAKLGFEGAGADDDAHILMADQRTREIDLKAHRKAVIGRKHRHSV